MPFVSVIVPCYNEENTIQLLLDAVYQQTFPKSEMEVLIADGLSTDLTREIINAFRKAHSDLEIRIIDNPKRIIPAALNCALSVAKGEYIVRLDAHSMPAMDYVERCIADLQANMGENVGGVWQVEPGTKGWMAASIATAASHPLGVGDARYRYTTQAALVDTVPFGAFRRSLIEKIGLFDEKLLTNEDYEFNARVIQQGGRIWLNPMIRSIYFARPNLVMLAAQYWRYGYWKLRMLRRYPTTIRWRQALPPLLVLSLVILLIAGILWEFTRWLLAVEILLYLGIIILVSSRLAIRKKNPGLLIGVPLAIATMHLSWGAGFLWSMVYLLIDHNQ
jgi:succinoglycan biosynthesis protein ExoA